MAEKRVSVRLAATGGRQVRSELEGVGEAGKRGFGRLTQEMDAANRRLAGFVRRVRVAAAAAVAAATAAGVAMIRSGLQTVDAQAKLAASLDTTVASIQVLERAGDLAGVSMGQVEQATVQLTRRLSQAASGTGPAVEALRRLRLSAEDLQALPLDARIATIQEALGQFVPEAERAAIASQLFGDRAALVFGRIDTDTLRQATRDVRDFGVVVSEQDAAQIERTNDAISRLGLIWRGLSNQLAVAAAPALEAVADAMAAVARTTGPLGMAIRGLFDNLGRLASITALMGTRYPALANWNGLSADQKALAERDTRTLLRSLAGDLRAGQDRGAQFFAKGLFDWNADYAFSIALVPLFLASWEEVRLELATRISDPDAQAMIAALIGLISDVVTQPEAYRTGFPSVIEATGQQFSYAGAGVNYNALPFAQRGTGRAPDPASAIFKTGGGRIYTVTNPVFRLFVRLGRYVAGLDSLLHAHQVAGGHSLERIRRRPDCRNSYMVALWP